MNRPVAPSIEVSSAQLKALLDAQEALNSVEAVNLIPRDMVRHGLFSGTNYTTRKKRLTLANQKIVELDWLTVTVDGEQFGQRESDIYSTLFAYAAYWGSYSFEMKLEPLFKRLGISLSTLARSLLFSDLERLTRTSLHLKMANTEREYECSGPLVMSYSQISSEDARTFSGVPVEDALRVQLNPEYGLALANSASRLFIPARQRRLLRGSPLSGWLYNYFKVHYKKRTITVGELKRYAGLAELRTDNLKRQLTKAQLSLAQVGLNLDIPNRLSESKKLLVTPVLKPSPVTPQAKPSKPPAQPWRDTEIQKLQAHRRKIDAQIEEKMREERLRVGLLGKPDR